MGLFNRGKRGGEAPQPEKIKKTPVLKWRGYLADSAPLVRNIVFVMLLMGCFALTTTQLGFLHLGVIDGRSTFLVTSLALISLTAVLLGTRSSMAFGVFAGIIMYAHARVMPLNYYELAFVTPITSIIELTGAGVLLGVFMARALRTEPTGRKRFMRIALICLFVSILYSAGFFVSAVIEMFHMLEGLGDVFVAESDLSEAADSLITRSIVRLHQVDVSIFGDALLMIFASYVGIVSSWAWMRTSGNIGLRQLFRAGLVSALAFVFLIVASVSFVALTYIEKGAEEVRMRNEVDYLFTQLDLSTGRMDVVSDLLNQAQLANENLSDEMLAEVDTSFSVGSILAGYTEDPDGLIAVARDGVIQCADNPLLEPGSLLLDYYSTEFIKSIDRCLDTGEMQRVIYDGAYALPETPEEAAELISMTELAFLYAERRGEDVIMLVRPTRMAYAERTGAMAALLNAFIAMLVATYVLISILVRRVVAETIDETNEVLEHITAGDLDSRVPASTTREFTSLAEGINQTVDTLQGWIDEANSRMDTELAAAATIQESALPRTFPPFPQIMKFDIFATMDPAREVGGDFYDFFLLGDNCGPESGKLVFTVADVSGKGVPASLFMMKAKAQIRDYILSGLELGEALENVNAELCDGNDAGMFVTAWVGVLDYGTGELTFVNAGHNPPLHWRRGEGWNWLTERSGLPLGLFDESSYKAHELNCVDGDKLILYSDGISEAMNVNEELYGEDRLIETAKENSDLPARELVEAVYGNVLEFAEGAEQSDDITVLALEAGAAPEDTEVLKVPATIDELDHVTSFINEELERRLCPIRVRNQLAIAVEEMFVNVCHYAYPNDDKDNPSSVVIERTYSANPSTITITIADYGIPFDPLAKADPSAPTSIEAAPIGGLGIFMAKKSVDEMYYDRVADNNVVTMVKRW